MGAREEVEIREQRELWKQAFEAGDVDRIMSFYAPASQTCAFDILPPLQFDSWDKYKNEWVRFLKLFDGTLKVEVQDAQITCSEDVAFIHALVHLAGMKDSRPYAVWIRATNGLRKIDGRWLVVHDHVSVPVDINTAKAAMELTP